jgi:hypothetical protein
MNFNHWRASPTVVRALIPSFALAFGIAHAADQTTARLDTGVAHNATQAARPARAAAPRRPLDLRVPHLRNVGSNSVLLGMIGLSADDEDQSVEIIAAPALVPMSSNTQAPLGIIGSLQWAIGHPALAFRIFLPSSLAP